MRSFLLVALFYAAAALAADVEPGNWEITVTTAFPGMPKPTAASQTRCISAAEAADPASLVTAKSGCQFSNRNDTGSVFTFNVACGGQLPMRGSGKVNYTRQSMDGELDLTSDTVVIGGEKLAFRSRMAGRRVGPCNAEK